MRIVCNTIHFFCYGGKKRIHNTFVVKDLKRINPNLAPLSGQYIGRHMLSHLVDMDVLSTVPIGSSRRYVRYRINFGEHELDDVIEKVVG